MVSGTHIIPISLGIRTWEWYGNSMGVKGSHSWGFLKIILKEFQMVGASQPLHGQVPVRSSPQLVIFLRNKLELQFFNVKKHSWRLEVLELISVFFLRQFMCYILSSVYSSVIFPCVFVFLSKAYLANG